MGVSTDAEISYGVIFEEDHEFPWDEYDDEDQWWKAVMNFEPTADPWTKEGDRVSNYSQEMVDQYHKEEKAFLKKTPLPFELVNYCSADYPMYILAVPGSVTTVSRGYPKEIKPETFIVPSGKAAVDFMEFLEKYLDCKEKPAWHLSSYWG